MTKMIATRVAYGEALAELGGINSDIVVLDADLSGSTKTAGFASKYPERFIQMGIAEADMMGTAAGLAATGKTAFASTFAVFATGRAFDQVRQSIAAPGLNVKICATHAGLTVGEDGGSHQSIEDIALMRVLPNMTVIVPSDAVQTGWAVRIAAEQKGPFYLRLGRASVPTLYDEDADFELGKAKTLREGQDVTIIAWCLPLRYASWIVASSFWISKSTSGIIITSAPPAIPDISARYPQSLPITSMANTL